jgi:hypothetical protein
VVFSRKSSLLDWTPSLDWNITVKFGLRGTGRSETFAARAGGKQTWGVESSEETRCGKRQRTPSARTWTRPGTRSPIICILVAHFRMGLVAPSHKSPGLEGKRERGGDFFFFFSVCWSRWRIGFFFSKIKKSKKKNQFLKIWEATRQAGEGSASIYSSAHLPRVCTRSREEEANI